MLSCEFCKKNRYFTKKLHCGMFDWVLNTPQPLFSTPPMPTTLAHRPFYPRQRTTHATHAGTSPQHAANVTHASTLPTQNTTHVSTPPAQPRHPRHSRQHKQQTISQFSQAFRSQIRRGNLAVFAFTFYCTTFTLKLNFFRGHQSALFKGRLFFQKQMRNFF